MKKKTKWIIVILIMVAIIVAVFLYTGENSKKAILVEVIDLKKELIVQKVTATGKIQPEIEIKISSEVSGEIINLPIKEGQQVNKGDLLVKINPDIYESGLNRMIATLSNSKAGLNQAEAQFKEAKRNYDRNKRLFDNGVISGAEWDKIISAYEVAQALKNSAYYNVQSMEASVTEAQDNLNRTAIYSPVDGTISKLDVEIGERVLGTQQMAGTELLRVANLNNMEVEVDVNESDIVKVKIGNKARIEVDAYSNKEFEGIVTSISNSASNTLMTDQVTNFKVKVRILKESYQDLIDETQDYYSPFRPGMTATVDVITQTNENVFVVPISSIVLRPEMDSTGNSVNNYKNKESVFVLNNGTVLLKPVQTGIQDEKNIEIIDGLSQGDKIIIGPYSIVNRELKDGDKAIAEIK